MTTLELDSHTIEVSNEDKLYFPDAGLTKGDLVDYYRRVADTMLPHVEGRPLVMHRFPDGIQGDGFIQKEVSRHFPEWVTTAELRKEGGTVTHVVADSAATLTYLAGQACITPHVWLSRVDQPEHPDQLVFDLDPPEGAGGAVVAHAARALREVLDELELPAYAKSSGSKGLHVHVPLDRSAPFDEARPFSKEVGDLVAARHPDRITTAARKAERKGRLFLDTLRNSYAQHAAAPYAVRALPGAPVAVPLDWDEATSSRFDPRRVTVENVFRRLSQKDDPWAGMHRAATSLDGARHRLRDARDSGP